MWYSMSDMCFDNAEKKSENNRTEEIGLVAPTPVLNTTQFNTKQGCIVLTWNIN